MRGMNRKNLQLIKAESGEEIILKQCLVQPDLVTSNDIKTPVTKGDILIHALPSGDIEKLKIVRVDAFTNLMPHYELKVEKLD